MFDSSGHYSSPFFFGNDYWLGSSTLCLDLQDVRYHVNTPPFPTNFFVAKVRLNYNNILTPVVSYLIFLKLKLILKLGAKTVGIKVKANA